MEVLSLSSKEKGHPKINRGKRIRLPGDFKGKKDGTKSQKKSTKEREKGAENGQTNGSRPFDESVRTASGGRLTTILGEISFNQ